MVSPIIPAPSRLRQEEHSGLHIEILTEREKTNKVGSPFDKSMSLILWGGRGEVTEMPSFGKGGFQKGR